VLSGKTCGIGHQQDRGLSKKQLRRQCDLVGKTVESGLDGTELIVAIDRRINSSAMPVYEVQLENQQE
jgi:hypothetical protein